MDRVGVDVDAAVRAGAVGGRGQGPRMGAARHPDLGGGEGGLTAAGGHQDRQAGEGEGDDPAGNRRVRARPAAPRPAALARPRGAVDGVLIPVRYLVNGRPSRRSRSDSIDYLHVELDRHDVLLAEGLPSESFLDTGNRAAFVGGGAALELHPEFSRRVWREQVRRARAVRAASGGGAAPAARAGRDARAPAHLRSRADD